MAKRRRKSQRSEIPGWLWMLFGLGIGLSVALAIYINDRSSTGAMRRHSTEPKSLAEPMASAVDDNRESAEIGSPRRRFDFYDMLPNFEVIIPEQEPDVSADTEPRAVTSPGIYVLQAGSFSEYTDADRRRAELALHGIESRIQRVTIEDKTYHRVRIGPVDNLDELNILRSRLREAKIDVLRIRLPD